MSEIFTSFKEMPTAYNKVRGELIRMGVLWRIPAKFANCSAIVKKWEAVREIIRRVAEEQE